MHAVDEYDADGPALSLGKTQEAILFFLQGSGVQLSTEQLVRLLYFADFDCFERIEQSITGATYRKREHGPESDGAATALKELEQAGRVIRHEIPFEGRLQHFYEARAHADLSVFSATERVTLNKVLKQWTPASEEQLEDAIRDEAPLVAVTVGDIIPYYLAHYRDNYGSMRLEAEELASMAQAQDEDEVIAR